MNMIDSAPAKKITTHINYPVHIFSNEIPFIFARHETFHPRYGWLKKGFDAASLDSEIFLKEDAPVLLGVGKNMVKSIRYWCHTFKLLEEVQVKGSRARVFKPTEFGKNLLNDDGWDPYLEDPASLWLLHWNFVKTPCRATAWHYAFNIFNLITFTTEDLIGGLENFVDHFDVKIKPNISSLSKDVSCLLRMYLTPSARKGLKEESLDCPFSDMGVLVSHGDNKYFSFNMGGKSTLPPEIIVAACLEYIFSTDHTAQTIAISRLCYDVGSPGQIFKLTEDSIYHAIEIVSDHNASLSISETAGIMQFAFAGNPKALSVKLLSRYYKKRK